MKKIILILFVFLASLSFALAPSHPVILESSVFDLLDNIADDGDYILVVGDNAPSSDSLAATDIAVGIQKISARGYSRRVSLEAKLASEITNEGKLILIGRSCDNPLIDLSCKDWPYQEGETLLMVQGNNLIISGTTAADTRSTAKIIARYDENKFLKESNVILITQDGYEIPEIVPDVKEEVEEVKEEIEEISETIEEEILEEVEEVKEEIKEKASFIDKILNWFRNLFR